MNSFRTIINIEPQPDKISYNSKVLFLGSCFTENIGNKFSALKMPVDINPFGIIYNPISVKNSLDILLNKKLFIKNDLQFFNEQWCSFYHHGRFSNSYAETCLKEINNRIEYSSAFLEETDFLFITFGTARVYTFLKTNQVVSNCHKIPANEFNIRLLSVEEIVEGYKTLLNLIFTINPKVKIIFTLSPVRHWKDGAEANQLSKATLLLAIHQLKDSFKNVSYFPSYEILMDDLREYRFYADDMLHPNQVAINYIWQKLSEVYFEEETKSIQKEIENISRAMHHRPFNKDSENYLKFQQNTLNTILKLEKKYTYLDFTEEKAFCLNR